MKKDYLTWSRTNKLCYIKLLHKNDSNIFNISKQLNILTSSNIVDSLNIVNSFAIVKEATIFLCNRIVNNKTYLIEQYWREALFMLSLSKWLSSRPWGGYRPQTPDEFVNKLTSLYTLQIENSPHI